MPVIGPSYNKQQADEAVDKVLELLKNQYRIMKHEPLHCIHDANKDRKEDIEKLREVIHEMFLHDCWESW